MVVMRDNDPDAGGPSPGDIHDYAETLARELAGLCARAGSGGAAQKFREAADLLARDRQNAAPGDAA